MHAHAHTQHTNTRTRARTRTRVCFNHRLYTEEGFDSLEDTTPPEIVRCDLASAVLQLKAMGIKDVLGFDFMHTCLLLIFPLFTAPPLSSPPPPPPCPHTRLTANHCLFVSRSPPCLSPAHTGRHSTHCGKRTCCCTHWVLWTRMGGSPPSAARCPHSP